MRSQVKQIADQAKIAAGQALSFDEIARTSVLNALADLIDQRHREILEANSKDLHEAQKNQLSDATVDRLRLSRQRLNDLAAGVRAIACQPVVVGEVISHEIMENGLHVKRQRVPIGVIAMIFESRPNVVIDCAALAIKSGNAMILKGGKEARNSNRSLADLVQESLEGHLPRHLIQLVDSTDRETFLELLKLPERIDLIIPRGGSALVQTIRAQTTIPVISHDKGLCHLYIHEDADLKMAKDLIINAKCQRPGVCNALETLLVHKTIAPRLFPELIDELTTQHRVTLRGCEDSLKFSSKISPASDRDWETEYLDLTLSIRIVDDLDSAIGWIRTYGSHHTEGICAKHPEIISRFINQVDASCVVVNASTRFNDGFQLGLGAEIGISTSKLHAYGPMGAREMTTTRFIVEGQGHIKSIP